MPRTTAVRSVSAEAAETLRSEILSGHYAPGDRLPAERALSVQLGVSRTALRDALRTLEATGYVEVRGRNRYVCGLREAESSSAALTWLLLHRNDLESLNQVRELLEPAAISGTDPGEAAALATALSEVVDAQTQAVLSGELHVAADLDTDFHSTLVSKTPNAPLRELTWQLIAMARIHATRVYAVRGVAAQSVAQHEDIIAAIRAGDMSTAATLAAEHARTAFRAALVPPAE